MDEQGMHYYVTVSRGFSADLAVPILAIQDWPTVKAMLGHLGEFAERATGATDHGTVQLSRTGGRHGRRA